MTSTRTGSLLIASLFSALLASSSSAQQALSFSLHGGIRPGLARAQIREQLGEPTHDVGGRATYKEQHLRLTFDFKNAERAIDVTGENDLEFAGQVLARLGDTPEQIHLKLGAPDEVSKAGLDDSHPPAQMDIYHRLYLEVYYRRDPESNELRVVMFGLTSPEMEEFFNTDPSEKKAP